MSFVATAIITYIAALIGYLSDSLPDTSLSQLDRACIAKFSTIRWRPWKKDGPTGFLLRQSMTVAMGALGWASAMADHDKGLEDDDKSRDVRERRSKGLEKFILALSDQQLVTGLAVLIAGFVSPCSMSIYHFNIIAALGWFSSTTHLSTLAVLRVYFIEHPRLRTWRVIAMLFVLALLSVAQMVPDTSMFDKSLPVYCAYTTRSNISLIHPNLLTLMLVVMFRGSFLLVTYSDRRVRLYTLDPEWSFQAWLMYAVMRGWGRKSWYNIGKIVIESSNKTKAEQGVLWRSVNETTIQQILRRFETKRIGRQAEASYPDNDDRD